MPEKVNQRPEEFDQPSKHSNDAKAGSEHLENRLSTLI